ncbi:putative Preprotein translocase subunit SecB [Gammaproteobacteria bacterium]
MNEELLQEAIQSLVIQGISLRQTRLELADGFDPALPSIELLVQFRASAKRAQMMEYQIEGEPVQHHFKVEFECGLRLAATALIRDEDPSTGQVAEIQVLFQADYLIKPGSTPSKAALDTFASVNVGYHVWPYWREYLQSTCARAGLPLIPLPMYTVPKEYQATKKPSRRRIAKS